MKKSTMKGKVGERQAADVLRPAFPNVRRRTYDEAQAGQGGATSASLGRDLEGTPGFCVQVQLAKTPTIEKKWSEALAARAHGEIPLALTRRSAKRKKGGGVATGPWLATLPAADLAQLIAERNRMSRTALDLAEDALRYKNDCDAKIREVERLERAVERARLEVVELLAKNERLAAELAKNTFGG